MNAQASKAIRNLRDYIAIPSINPMGRHDIDADLAGERRYAEHVYEQLRALGVDARIVGSAERSSVVGEITVAGATDTLMVASHLDTVPVDGMEIAPFDPVITKGRVYGRGACDTKAGMAALMAAVQHLLERGRLRRNLVLVGEADEEMSSRGIQDVLAQLGGRRPDWAIATEPTGLRLVNRHKGIALLRLGASGRACHSSDPGAGCSAIVNLAKAIVALEGLGVQLSQRPHPQLGPPTLSVGVIGGGQAPNIVPSEAWALMDRRMIPGETPESVAREVTERFADAAVEDVRVTACHVEKHPLETPETHVIVRRCRCLLEQAGYVSDPTSVAFGTDAGPLAAAGIPSVVWGPGSIAQAHTADEYVEVGQVESMVALFTALLSSDA